MIINSLTERLSPVSAYLSFLVYRDDARNQYEEKKKKDKKAKINWLSEGRKYGVTERTKT